MHYLVVRNPNKSILFLSSLKSFILGMKRKLSVGIALIANSKVVILDEPTSGKNFRFDYY